MKQRMKLRLRHKVIGLALFSALLPALFLGVFVAVQERYSSAIIEVELATIVDANLKELVREIRGLCVTTNDLVQQRVNSGIKVASYVLKQRGAVSFSKEKVEWDAINQYSEKVSNISLPKMLVGGEWLGKNTSHLKLTPVVDEIRELVGGTVTIFQRMNEAGDMLRVATNVAQIDGERAISTYIPAVNPDGLLNPVIRTVLEGETYHGPAFVVNDWYLTAYEPIKNAAGYVVGIIYVGMRRESVSSLRHAIQQLTIGDRGYVWIMNGSDHKQAGKFVFLQNNFPHTQEIDKIHDVAGKPFFDDIRKSAIKMKADAIAMKSVHWRDKIDDSILHKTKIYYTYYSDWDWIIGVTAFAEDFEKAKKEIKSAFYEIQIGTLLGGAAVVIIVAIIATYLGGLIARPIDYITGVAMRVASGDLGGALNLMHPTDKASRHRVAVLYKAEDETGELYRAIKGMIENLKALVGQVQISSSQLIDSAREISETAALQEGTVQDFGSSSMEIATAVKEISSTAQELNQTMGKVSDSARSTATVAGEGRFYLDNLHKGAEELQEATASIAERLSIISERAHNINNVVTTISKVADQTNLLSLNAAIEAEKAGDLSKPKDLE